MRASSAPMQRWMPWPKARCGVGEAARVESARRSDVSRGSRSAPRGASQQPPSPQALTSTPADGPCPGVANRGERHLDDGEVAQQLLDEAVHGLGLVPAHQRRSYSGSRSSTIAPSASIEAEVSRPPVSRPSGELGELLGVERSSPCSRMSIPGRPVAGVGALAARPTIRAGSRSKLGDVVEGREGPAEQVEPGGGESDWTRRARSTGCPAARQSSATGIGSAKVAHQVDLLAGRGEGGHRVEALRRRFSG